MIEDLIKELIEALKENTKAHLSGTSEPMQDERKEILPQKPDIVNKKVKKVSIEDLREIGLKLVKYGKGNENVRIAQKYGSDRLTNLEDNKVELAYNDLKEVLSQHEPF